MKNEKLILKDNNPKEYVVVNLEDGTSFVHNNKTGKNYFSNKTIAKCTGIEESTVRDHWAKFKELNNNVDIIDVNLKVLNIRKPVNFKSFDFFTYVAYTSNKPEAVQMRNYIVNAIDEKFNVDAGFTQPETNHIDVFKLECERDDLQGRLKDTSNGISVMSQRARLLEQNGDMEKLERTQAVISDLSNEFNDITLLISDITELIDCSEKVTELSPKVTNNKFFGQNHLIPFKKS